ncbi:cGMP-inhibited 3',5'-cyclic phosphodiesterase B [Frankliniella fusca]|uniref:cGMP-inhibited 3',5'-cyclic phosphodiesterase B n=1 Tax=Frankliniella fusca TaxID=407009 RepID=A0AAE1I286_9NEOP|nr:cGMP-inhibited 3',5'-cyclic phosphodiesterase B [Frankliniella fusca]
MGLGGVGDEMQDATPRPRAVPATPTVSSELKMWDDILSGVGLRHCLLVLLFNTFVWLWPAFLLCSGARTLLAASVPDALRSVCGTFALYSSGAAAVLFTFRSKRLLGVLRRTRHLVGRHQQLPVVDKDGDETHSGFPRD